MARFMRAIHNPVAFGLNYRDLSRDSSPMRPERSYYVYILASGPSGTLYTGTTNNLARRVYEHREGLVEGFTKRYGVKRLVYFDIFATAADAIPREPDQEVSARLEVKFDCANESGVA